MQLYFNENGKLVFTPNYGVILSAIDVYEPESLSYFTRMDVQPTDERKILINRVIRGLKINNIWNTIDILRFSASHTSQSALLNLKGDYWNATLGGTSGQTPTFYVDRGFIGQVSNKWIDTNFNPFNGGCNYSRDSAMTITYQNNNVGGVQYYLLYGGCVIGGLCQYNNAANTYGTINSNSATATNDGVSTKHQFKWMRRSSSAGFYFGTNLISVYRVRGSADIVDSTMTECQGPGRQVLFMIGGSLDDDQLVIFEELTLEYLTAIGANI